MTGVIVSYDLGSIQWHMMGSATELSKLASLGTIILTAL